MLFSTMCHPEQREGSRAVTWQETSARCLLFPSASDLKVHFVQHDKIMFLDNIYIIANIFEK